MSVSMSENEATLMFRFELAEPIRRLVDFVQITPSVDVPYQLLEPLYAILRYASTCPTELSVDVQAQKASVLQCVAELLLVPDLTLEIIALFRPCMIDLTSRLIHTVKQEAGLTRSPIHSQNKRKLNVIELPAAIPRNDHTECPFRSADISLDAEEPMDSTCFLAPGKSTFTHHEALSIALSKIVLVVPQIFHLLSNYFATHASPLERVFTFDPSSLNCTQINELLCASYRLLVAVPSVKKHFHVHRLFTLLEDPILSREPSTRCYMAHLLCYAFSLSDKDASIFLEKNSHDDYAPASNELFSAETKYTPYVKDFFILEHKTFLRSLQQRIFEAPITLPAYPIWMDATDLSPFVENVCGILFPMDRPRISSVPTLTRLLDTPTTVKNLRVLAMAVSLGSPVLLEGVSGSGKTTLIEELARRLRLSSEVVKIHLGDQVDGKALLGSYIATCTPGQFIWSRGVLTRAVEEGHWVILEDIDTVSQEIVSILIPLLETRTLFIAQRGQRVKAHPQFQLFATCSLDPYTLSPKNTKSYSLTLSLWTRVGIDPLPEFELVPILIHKFPRLELLALNLVKTFLALQELFNAPVYRTSAGYAVRFVSTRDLIKWCYRIETLVTQDFSSAHPMSQEDATVLEAIFVEAMDVFIGLLPTCALKEQALALLSAHLNVPQERIEFYLHHFAPALHSSSLSFSCGRVTFPLSLKNLQLKSTQPFTYTAYSKRLLEKLAVCTYLNEPTLLIGETGTGKTSVVQHLAAMLNKKLHVVNLSQQSDSSDLLGGFKPIAMALQLEHLSETFLELFAATFSVKKNQDFLNLLQTARERKRTDAILKLFQQAIDLAQARFDKSREAAKCSNTDLKEMAWRKFIVQFEQFRHFCSLEKKNVLFQYVEGILVSALRKGDWILLDEVNLATFETLETLSGLLEREGSLLLAERGDETSILKHPEFRLFACMNPSTDIGKKDLPVGLRNRFTELYVDSPDANLSDLKLIISTYLSNCVHTDPQILQDLVDFYTRAKEFALTKLYDGAGLRPYFSLRTLTRALTFAATVVPLYGVRRALYEGISLTFLTALDLPSQACLSSILYHYLFHERASQYLKAPVTSPPNSDDFVQLGNFWLKKGPLSSCTASSRASDKPYILSPTVQRNLAHLARSVMTQKYPVLIQGPTSSGKTSMVEYLAKITGHAFVRVNNHAHTDLQEYIGCYVSDDQGTLIFKEGTLVTALREGHWVVLDELNLAPTDVLEALNRLLDENRELFIPETQQWIHPHPQFMLFATQNPPSYGGRKLLSRAFRNRFLELHFDDLPDEELLQILSQRCAIAPSFAKKIVQVYQELRKRRQESRIFDGKASFITLRDLFRWADRVPASYDELAIHGFMILGERVRNPEEQTQILDVLQDVLRVKLDPTAYYAKLFREHMHTLPTNIVWNSSMQRLFALTYICQMHYEPILLVGETGCGKTTICQILAAIHEKALTMVNCHQYSETSDFIGSQRPCRNMSTNDRLFEWHDGPLVIAMKQGDFFLLDEISLADDSVLERLNSLLEPSRTLLIAEKGGDAELIVSHTDFRFFATMNPGGDYGKKELSPALRNRFTEIWTPPITAYEDRLMILKSHLRFEGVPFDYASRILDYIVWYEKECEQRHIHTLVSIRDLISWSTFITTTHALLSLEDAIYHGACLVLLDGIKNISFREQCLLELQHRTKRQFNDSNMLEPKTTESSFGIEPFLIPKGPHPCQAPNHSFHAPTSKENLYRLLRALFSTSKSILLEGSPGVGKTSLVSALANISGHRLIRINLSEQTDLVDLFGSDLPVEGGQAGAFAWRDGLFLSAMKNGDWVLLDELNLACQSVLEGLNACLDHRGTIYIPELNQSFQKHPDFRIFGAQNPMEEGGGRRGLPKSFLNRFTPIYLEPLLHSDYILILNAVFPNVVTEEELSHMIHFNSLMHQKTMVDRDFGVIGSPWEFNLRDLLRWLELKAKYPQYPISTFLDLIYFHRLQTPQDVEKATNVWLEASQQLEIFRPPFSLLVTPESVLLGLVHFPRVSDGIKATPLNDLHVPHSMLRPLHAILLCLEMDWMVMVNGPSASGKTYLVRTAAALCGRELVEYSVHKSVDAIELLGGFEQIDSTRCWEQLCSRLQQDTLAILPALMKLGNLPNETQTLASYTTCALSLGSATMSLWIEQLHELSHYLALPDHHSLHLDLLQRYQKAQEDAAGKFEWVDGIFLDAVQTGKWLLLENANICSPSVLDRLNPLFESKVNHRQLIINERGMNMAGEFVVIQPHPDFRMFMTMNHVHGQVSRALRNRGIEISLFEGQWLRDEWTLSQVMESNGIVDPLMRDQLWNLLNTTSSLPREIVLSIAYTTDLLQRGFPRHKILNHTVLFPSASATSFSPTETSKSMHLVPLHSSIFLQHSMASLIGTKFSFVNNIPSALADFLEPALDWILLDPTTAIFFNSVLAWLKWRERKLPTPMFSITDFRKILLRIYQLLPSNAFSEPLLVKCFLQHVKFLLKREDVLSIIQDVPSNSMNVFQRSYSKHAFPERVLVPSLTPPENHLFSLMNAFDHCMLQNLHQDFELRSLDVLTYTESMWEKCYIASEVDLDLLDAHVTQLLKLIGPSPLFASFRSVLLSLQASYSGDMEVARVMWARFHPWIVRSLPLFEPVRQLESLSLAQLPQQLVELISDALLNMYLGDVEHQSSLEQDFPRLLNLVASNSFKGPNENEDATKLPFLDNCVATLKKKQELLGCQYSQKLRKWIWAIQVFQFLPKAHSESQFIISLLPSCPTIKERISLKLLHWSITHQKFLERSWNQLYFDYQRIIIEHPLWNVYPKELSVELCKRSRTESVLGIDSLKKWVSNTISLLLDHHSKFDWDFRTIEESVLKTRLRLLSNLPSCKEAEEHLVQVELSMKETTLYGLGEAWINLGLAFLKFAIPASPLDPATRYKLSYQTALQMQFKFDRELKAFKLLLNRDNSARENSITVWLTEKLEQVKKLILESGRQMYLRPENSSSHLRILFSDLRQLFSSLFDPKELLKTLLDNACWDGFQERFSVIRQSFLSFIGKTKMRFPLFVDLLEPIYTGIFDVLHGFNLICAHASQCPLSFAQSVSEHLPWISHQTFFSVLEILPSLPSKQSIPLSVSVLETLAKFKQCDSNFEVDPSLLSLLLKILISEFTAMKEKEKAEREENARAFKYATTSHEILDDESETDWLDTKDNAHLTLLEDAVTSVEERLTLFQPDQTATDSDLHPNQGMNKSNSAELVHWMSRAFIAFQAIYGSFKFEVFSVNDVTSVTVPSLASDTLSHLLALSESYQSFSSEKNLSTYDFYRNSNSPEVSRLIPILTKLDRQLKALLEEWPEHSALQQIMAAACRISTFSAHMPLIKYLESLEFLIQKCDEWEKFAASHVSLKETIQALSAIIVDWRRLELGCWRTFLDWYDKQQLKDGSVLWLHLLSILNFEEDITGTELIVSLDEFFLGSTLGQFPLRIQILSSLSTHFKNHLIWNVLQYYREFLPYVLETLSVGRSAIEKELKDFIKIAGWRDVNIYSLKISAQKTHKQLGKCLKKYRELLNRPLVATLKEKGTLYFGDQVTVIKEKLSLSYSKTVFLYPEAVACLFKNNPVPWKETRDGQMERIVAKSATFGSKLLVLPNLFEVLSQDIIDQILSFKSETDGIREAITKEESSFLLQCRKKALSDMLKRFKELGLIWHHSVLPELPDLMQSIAIRPEISKSLFSLLQSANTYFFRVSTYLPFFISKRSPDLEPKQADRVLGYMTDLFKHTMEERSKIFPVVNQLNELQDLIHAWSAQSTLAPTETEWVETDTILSLKFDVTSMVVYIKHLLNMNSVSSNARQLLESLVSQLKNTLQSLNHSILLHSSILYFNRNALQSWESKRTALLNEIKLLETTSPRDAPFLRPIFETLSRPLNSISFYLEEHIESNVLENFDNVIEDIMIQIQHLFNFNSVEATYTFKSLHAEIASLLSKLNIGFLDQLFKTVFTRVSPNLQYYICKRLVPLLQNYSEYLNTTLYNILVHHKSLAKCTYVLCTNAFKLIERGFCVPTPVDGNDKNDTGQGQELEAADGTGIGQGEGQKDVSNEIENEGQVEGLQGEEQYNPAHQKENENDEGIEMERDFEGNLEDLKLDHGDQDSDGDCNMDSTDDEKDDMMNEVDNPESHTVDPTLWDEESDDEKEMREAEEIDQKAVNCDSHNVETLEETQNQQEEPDSNQAPSTENLEGHVEDFSKKESKDTLEDPRENTQEGDGESNEKKEDAHDDIDMENGFSEAESFDDDTKETGYSNEIIEKDVDLGMKDEASPDSDVPMPEQPEDDEIPKDNGETVSDDQSVNGEGPDTCEVNGEDVLPMCIDESGCENETEKLSKDPKVNEEDVYGTEEPDINGNEAIDENYENEDERPQNEFQPTIAGHSNKNDGQDDAIDHTKDMAEQHGASQQQTHDSRNMSSENQSSPNEDALQPSDFTPSLTKDIETWKRRLKMVERHFLPKQEKKKEGEEANEDAQKEQEYTYLQDDEETMTNDEQMLGAVDPNQARDLPFPLEEKHEETSPSQERVPYAQGPTLQEQLAQTMTGVQPTLSAEEEIKVQLFARPTPEPLSPEEEKEYRKHLLDHVDMWREKDRDLASCVALWHGCKNLTFPYATQLTEQLRLLLEPTLASHLTGDYKTGKRLNMRRILSYIASDFKKDKIWLRRTKPNQRDYQVLVAVDDSQSMNDSSAIQLAFESVCLITRSMEQLEVGPIALCSFGEDVKVLHSFGQRFTDDAGIRAFQSFQFNQSRTNIDALLNSALMLFQSTQSQNMPWRLMLILSDGLCDHHKKLRHLVRKAAEERILTVCIVLDQRDESILKMSSVNFENGQLRMAQYMDDFPFDFYVILRDVRRLPMVLSDALRQFFALSASS